jgi:hypothetical protein
MDPKWSSARDRLRLIQTVDRLDMKESVPGLIAVLGEVGNRTERSYAAESLATFRDPRAIPGLRTALEREKSADDRRRIINGLIDCGGVSAEEAARAVEAFAEFTFTPEGKQKWAASEYSHGVIDVPVEVALGAYITNKGPESDDTVEMLVKRVEELKLTRADFAREIQSLIAGWPSKVADRTALLHLRNGTVMAEVLAAALQRRESLQKTLNSELREIEKMSGQAAGFAAVLLGDRQKEIAILTDGDNREAKIALFVGARLVREKLPLEDVQKLQSQGDTFLMAAIDAYLESEDSPEARKLYLEQHKGQFKILGARESFGPASRSSREFNDLEKLLLDEFKRANDGGEMFALLSAGYWGSAGQIIIRPNSSGAEIMFEEDPARYYIRKLTGSEWREFQSFIHENHVDDLGPLNREAGDSIRYEYVHVTRDGGRRVFISDPGPGNSEESLYNKLRKIFQEMVGSSHLDLHYRMDGKTAGFEVLVADDRFIIGSPWKQGGDMRMTVYPDWRSRGGAFSNNGVWRVKTSPDLPKELSWVTLRNGRLISVSQPPTFPQDDPEKAVPERLEKQRRERGNDSQVWPLTVGGKTYRVANWNHKDGLWLFQRGQDPKLVIEGRFAWPVITPDGNWALLAQSEKTWAEPSLVVRVDLASGQSFGLDIPVADRVIPLSFVAAHDRILVVRRADHDIHDREPVGPKIPEFWLVDASTGNAHVVQGEFSPLANVGERPLQVAAGDGRFWAAIYSETEGATEIGIYNPKLFGFSPVLIVPGLQFGSQQMWIDELEHKAYISYRGHLLRISMSELPH